MTDFGKIVVVGGSMAGLRAAEALRSEGFTGSLVIVGDERHSPYDRPPLSKEFLLGQVQESDIALGFASGIDAEWLVGNAAVGLDADAHVITLADDRKVDFDGLVIATGSMPRRLPGLEPDGDSVFHLRKLEDSLGLRTKLTEGNRLLIVGSGFIGVEVASRARQRGLEVSMVSSGMPLAVAGSLVTGVVAEMLHAADVDTHFGRTIVTHRVDGGAHQVTPDDGSTMTADVVLVAIGALPQIAWLADSGLRLGDGVLCDATLHAAPDVVAAGDIVNWPNPRFSDQMMRVEHWANATEQGRAAARSLLHGPDALPFGSVPSFWSDHFGVRVQSIGVLSLADEFRVSDGDPAERRFAAGAYRDGHLVGAISYAMPRDCSSTTALSLQQASRYNVFTYSGTTVVTICAIDQPTPPGCADGSSRCAAPS